MQTRGRGLRKKKSLNELLAENKGFENEWRELQNVFCGVIDDRKSPVTSSPSVAEINDKKKGVPNKEKNQDNGIVNSMCEFSDLDMSMSDDEISENEESEKENIEWQKMVERLSGVASQDKKIVFATLSKIGWIAEWTQKIENEKARKEKKTAGLRMLVNSHKKKINQLEQTIKEKDFCPQATPLRVEKANQNDFEEKGNRSYVKITKIAPAQYEPGPKHRRAIEWGGKNS